MNNQNKNIINSVPSADTLWNGSHKIPWNDPAFSARILKEHLSQEHDLASRKTEFIEAQTEWIHGHCLNNRPASILDLGCGPGLYSQRLAAGTHAYHGIDFSPASIDYAHSMFAVPGQCEFRLGDVTQADFGGPYDLTMMLYGELNVFSPAHCLRILVKAHEALVPGGRLLVEYQNPAAIKGMVAGPNTWTRADEGGLFSDQPYVCLTENHWFEVEATALQCFHVMEADGTSSTYRSTTKAWSFDELASILSTAGFSDVVQHDDWPIPNDSLRLLSASK